MSQYENEIGKNNEDEYGLSSESVQALLREIVRILEDLPDSLLIVDTTLVDETEVNLQSESTTTDVVQQNSSDEKGEDEPDEIPQDCCLLVSGVSPLSTGDFQSEAVQLSSAEEEPEGEAVESPTKLDHTY